MCEGEREKPCCTAATERVVCDEMLKKLIQSSYKQMPWKNGKGTTTELFRYPSASSTATTSTAAGDFEWRVSSAIVAEDGAFSFFPGYTRSIATLDEDLIINISPKSGLESQRTRLDKYSPPFLFSGDDVTDGQLVDGKRVTDFNVISDDSKCKQEVHRVVSLDNSTRLQEGIINKLAVESLMFCCIRGHITIVTVDDKVVVSNGESCLVDDEYEGEVQYKCASASPGVSNGAMDVFVVKIRK